MHCDRSGSQGLSVTTHSIRANGDVTEAAREMRT